MSQIALNSALSALQIATKRLEVLAHDIANKNTTGYKARDLRSVDLMYSQSSRASAGLGGEGSPSQTQVGHGARVSSVTRLIGQGAMKQTGAPLDLMINGRGYFAVTLSDGRVAFTRDGSFSVNHEGTVVTKSGEALEGDIKITGDPQRVIVSTDGVVSGGTEEGSSIKIFTFANEQGLEALSNNLFLPTEASGPPQDAAPGQGGAGTIQQGAIETSNVDPAKVMCDFMDASSTYELAIRVLETINRMERRSIEAMRA